MPHRQRCTHHSYTYFRVAGHLPGLPNPYFVGHYGSANPSWRSNSDFVIGEMGYVACCLAGSGRVHVGDDERAFVPGVAYACRWDNPEVWHVCTSRTEELRWVFLVFRGSTALTILDDMLARYGPLFTLDTQSSLIYRLMTVSRQPAHDTGLSASDGAALVWDVLRALLNAGEQSWHLQTRVDLADAAAQMVRERDLANLSVAAVARHLDVSREHLARVFSHRYGQSLSSYLLSVKMQEACLLLRDSNTPVKGIAERLGYSTYPSFHRAFRTQVGATPGRYRSNLGI